MPSPSLNVWALIVKALADQFGAAPQPEPAAKGPSYAMPPLPPGEALAEQRASERNFMRLYKDDPVLNQALINRFYEPKYGQRAIDRFMPRLAKPATPFFSWQMLPGQPPLVTSGNLDWGMKMPWADPNPEERKFDIVTSGDLDA